MHDDQRPAVATVSKRRFGVAALPLVLAYLLLPLAGVASRLHPAWRLPAWLPVNWPWLALTGTGLAGALVVLVVRRRKRGDISWLAAAVAILAGSLLALAAARLAQDHFQGPYFPDERFWLLTLPEAAPLVFCLVAGTWAYTFGAPRRVWFRYCGALLGGLVVVDVLLASLMAGFPVPGGILLDQVRLEHRAFLLGVALLLGVDDEERVGLYPSWSVMLIMAGILGSGSPVALLAAGAAYLFLGRERIEARIGFALACAGGVSGPLFGAASLRMDGRLQVYLTWLAGMESFAADPMALLKGFGPWPHDFTLPPAVASILGMPDMSFTLPPRAVPSFWMRATLVWGVLPPLALLLTSIMLTALTPGRGMAAIMALALVQGVVFPLLYDGSAAVVFCLAVTSVLASGVVVLRAQETDTAVAADPNVSSPAEIPSDETTSIS